MRYFFFFAILISACSPDTQGDVVTPSASEPQSTVTKPQASGQLFIIGGGKLHVPLMQAMVEEGGIAKTDLIVVIPAASEEPDTAIYYDSMPFLEMGYTNVKPLRLSAADSLGGTRVDSLMMAKGIFLCGGDQSRLMAVIGQPKILGKLHEAYREGAVIGGTSAGAAVMSAIMITGDQKKEPDYESTYRRLKTNNGMYAQGTGLFANGIIDQHFIERSRFNRALTALYEFPDKTVYGVGESTALRVASDGLYVHGYGQIVVFNPPVGVKLKDDLIGYDEVSMKIFLPGDTIARY